MTARQISRICKSARMVCGIAVAAWAFPPTSAAQSPLARKIPTMTAEFIFVQAPFEQCHASTLVELPNGDLLAAWFGGLREGDPSVAVWGARRSKSSWSKPRRLAREPGVPCWNPVLFRDRRDRILLFYKYGSSPQTWRGAYRTSRDGKTWSPPSYLAAGLLGPIKNKPIILSNGDVLAGSSVETASTWQCWAERSSDQCLTWTRYGPIVVPGVPYGVIQPTMWEVAPEHVKMLMRSTQQIGFICEATSVDGGRTWGPAKPTTLPNPNSGIDAVKMTDGTVALVYNHTKSGRSPLNIDFSRDNGISWSPPYVLEDEPGEYSYPAIIQTRDGMLHVAYTWQRRRIKHVAIDPSAAFER